MIPFSTNHLLVLDLLMVSNVRSVQSSIHWSTVGLPILLAFIFCTSCTVVRPTEFFGLIHRSLLTDEHSMEAFRVVWGVIWIFVVKGWHFTEFALLTVLLQRVLKDRMVFSHKKASVWSALLSIGFAISDEWHQTFVPDRFGTVTDVMIDASGVLTAVLVTSISWNRFKRLCF